MVSNKSSYFRMTCPAFHA